MKILYKKKTENCKLIVAEIISATDSLYSELLDDFSENDITVYQNIKNEKRKKEWLGIRILLKNIFGKYIEIKYGNYGSPYIENDYNISISHSNNLISLILCKKIEVGIDIEKISPKIARIALKFMKQTEIDSVSDNEIEFMYANWCGKETLYKIYKKGGLDYRKHLKISTSKIEKSGTLTGKISFNEINKEYTLNYTFINSTDNEKFLLVWHC